MKRILLASNYSNNDMTAFLRSYGPFTLMRDDVEIVPVPNNSDWITDFRYWVGIDICFLHRPFAGYGRKVIEQCKTHRVPLWVDHDDDLLAIPENSPHHGITLLDRQFGTVELSYKEADILTCSSEIMHAELKAKYKRDDAILIPTGLDDRLLQFKKQFTKNNKIAWRGSPSHLADLRAFKEEINEVVGKYPDKEWHFFGIDPRQVGINPKQLIVWPQMNIFEFYNIITEVNASVQFVVLEDNKFNRVKSNLSWLDATLAGSACLAPDFEDNRRPGIGTYNPSFFAASFSNAVDSEARELCNAASWEYIKDNLIQSVLNKKRYEIIRNT